MTGKERCEAARARSSRVAGSVFAILFACAIAMEALLGRAEGRHLRADDTIQDLLNHAAFTGFARLLLPGDDRTYDGRMALRDLGTLLPYHSHVDTPSVVGALNEMIDDVNGGKSIFHDIYTDQKAEDPGKAKTGLFFLRGRPGAPFAVIAPGGGFAYVGSIHEGFPYAVAIRRRGYNAFVLKYRVGSGGVPATRDLAAALQLADVKRVERQQLTRLGGFDVPHGLRGAFREHADSSRTRVLQYRESRGARAQLLASQQAPDRDRRDRHAVPRELIAVPLRAACRPRQSKGDHPSLRLHRDRRRAAAPRLSALRMDPVGAVLFEARSQPIEHRPRHPMPAARFTDVPQLLGVAHHAQSLTVYAVLEGHRLIPFHVSPPRETRGRIGRPALLSFQRSNDSTC